MQLLQVTALLVLGAGLCAYATITFGYRWIDVAVYRWGGETVFDSPNLYMTMHPSLGMPFTYTPFAAILFTAFAAVGALAPWSWSIVSGVALVRASWLLSGHRGRWFDSVGRGWAAAAIAAGILASQPGSSNVRLGQIGFVLLWMVCEDMLARDRRGRGALVGLAAAIKLTPVVFLLFYVVVGRIREALVAAAVIAASIAGAWLLVTTESRWYWRHMGPDVTTVGPVTAPDHWSINGTVWRVAGAGGNDRLWLLLAAATMLGSLALARLWWQRERHAGAVGLVGLGSVLASPFSWSHHWLIVTPLFVALLAEAADATHARRWRPLIGVAYALLLTGVWWHAPRVLLELATSDSTAASIAANTYLLVAAILFALAIALRPRATSTGMERLATSGAVRQRSVV